MLRLRGIGRTYPVRRAPVHALREIDLDITADVLTAVLGPSGSGKSTLLRIIAGFERPDHGTVTLGERLLAGPGTFVRPERRGIGVVPQDGALFPHLDVAGNIGFGLTGSPAARLRLPARRARAERVAELLDMVGLPGYQRRRVDELSGGEQQRVALARALAPGPGVVLLDEPFSAIDAALRAELGIEVRALLRRLGVTAVLVTHDQSEALSLADEVVVMRAGRVAQTGTPREVYERPADAATARFVGDAMVLPAHTGPAPDLVRCALGTLAVAPGTAPAPGSPCHVVLRPEHLTLAGPTAAGMPARVEAFEYYGHDAMLTLRLDGTDRADGDTHGLDEGPAPATVRVRTHDLDPAALLGRSVHIEVRGPALVLQ